MDFEGEDFLFMQYRDGDYAPLYPAGVCRLKGAAVENTLKERHE